MQCKDVTNDLLADRLDGTLDPGTREDLDGHLDGCDECRRRAEEIERILSAVETSIPETEVPERVDRAVADVIRESAGKRETAQKPPAVPRPGLPWRILIPSAAALVFAVAGFLAGAMTGLPGIIGSARYSGTAPEGDLLAETAEKLEMAEEAREQLAESLASVKAELEGIRSERKQLEADMAKGNALLENAAGEIRTFRVKVEEVQAGIETGRERAVTLAGERDELRRRLSALEEDLNGSAKRVAECSSRIDRLERENRTLSGEVGSARAEVASLTERNRELEVRLRVRGDLNRDGSTDIRDVREICLRLAGSEKIPFVPEADMNGDGKIDVADALLIAKFSTGSH